MKFDQQPTTNNPQPTNIIILWHLLRYTGSIGSDSASHIGQQKADITIGWKRICNHVFVCISAFFWCFLMFFLIFLKKKGKKIWFIEIKALPLQSLSWIQSFYLKKANTYWDWNVRTVRWGRFFIVCSYDNPITPSSWCHLSSKL